MRILTDKERFIFLAKHGIIESNDPRGRYQIQRIDFPEEFADQAGLDFIPPKLDNDAKAAHAFRNLSLNDFENAAKIKLPS